MRDVEAMPKAMATLRLDLRFWREDDAVSYRKLWLERDARASRLIDADGRPTVEDLRENIRRQLAATEAQGYGLYAVTRRTDGQFLGYCGLIANLAAVDAPEMAVELMRHAHNRGYATEAARAVRDAATATGRTRLCAGVRIWNVASLRMLDKVGFKPSGRVTENPVGGDTIWLTCELGVAT